MPSKSSESSGAASESSEPSKLPCLLEQELARRVWKPTLVATLVGCGYLQYTIAHDVNLGSIWNGKFGDLGRIDCVKRLKVGKTRSKWAWRFWKPALVAIPVGCAYLQYEIAQAVDLESMFNETFCDLTRIDCVASAPTKENASANGTVRQSPVLVTK